MPEALIYDCVRTPRGRGRPNGALHSLSPVELAAEVLKALDERTGFADAGLEDVIFGVGDGVNDQGGDVARAAVLLAGMPEHVPGSTVSRFCASGLDAVNAAAAHLTGYAPDQMVGRMVDELMDVPRCLV